jgi:hypothetical protein
VRAFIYALISSLLLSVHVGKVCPVIAQYPFWKWTLLCLSAYAGMSLAAPANLRGIRAVFSIHLSFIQQIAYIALAI